MTARGHIWRGITPSELEPGSNRWRCKKCGGISGRGWDNGPPMKSDYIWIDTLPITDIAKQEIIESTFSNGVCYSGLTCDQYLILNTHLELT